MNFVDLARVYIKAGKGGNGAISFRREIYIPKGGPDGGDGGKGGDVVFVASKDLDTLLDFRFQPRLIAADGDKGAGKKSSGKAGADLEVKVPVGTIVKKLPDSTPGDLIALSAKPWPVLADLNADGKRVVVAKGGEGGYGNWHFRSSVRQTPRFAELGNDGESFSALLELKLLADVGIVGLPSAGKSSFLAVVTAAKPAIADYPFTTLVPNLGVAKIDTHSLVFADIPGLIAGASLGKGLGDEFLRHIERTKVLLHLIDVYQEDAGLSYQIIQDELKHFKVDLSKKPQIVALTKVEGVSADMIAAQQKRILARNPKAQIFAISSLAHQGLTPLLRAIYALYQSTSAPQFSSARSTSAKLQGASTTPKAASSAPETLPVISLDNTALNHRPHHERYSLDED